MSDVRKADPVVRRRTVLFFALTAVLGALLIFLLERYLVPLRNWVLADPEISAAQGSMIIMLLAALSLAPLIGLAGYLWSLGGRTLRAKEFPPPGLRVIRDTRIITGEAAASRGRQLKLLAVGCLVVSLALSLLLWNLASLFNDYAV